MFCRIPSETVRRVTASFWSTILPAGALFASFLKHRSGLPDVVGVDDTHYIAAIHRLHDDGRDTIVVVYRYRNRRRVSLMLETS